MRDRRFDILFEPVKIGPVTAPNRFYQVPHCTGMGYVLPQTLAAMRAMKAEGGWGVVNTEYCSIHPSSDDVPYPFCSLWDDQDVRNMAAMTEAVHAHGSLAGVELWHGGARSSNLNSRHAPLGPESLTVSNDPWQSQKMDTADVKTFRGWHRDAVRRARRAGFDIIYVYAAHTYLLAQFLDPLQNRRNDDHGGTPENRARLLRDLLEETKEEAGETCAIAVRIEVDNEDGSSDGRAELLASIAPFCDLFDVTVADYTHEMGVSRFVAEASLESHVAHVRQLTGKPVVSVGRFTSPETMLSQVRRGVLDFIGAARPSIADPFLPQKIRDGRFDEIRECIGCNICYAGDGRGVPIRCTQNPTMGEEWRRGWHPETVPPAHASETALVVGAGPAGLEAAHVLSKRGYQVLLAEAGDEVGGRVAREARLPGLAEWIRVRDHRLTALSRHAGVSIYLESTMTPGDIADTGARHVFIATGSHWRRDGRGRTSPAPIAGLGGAEILTPDDIMGGRRPKGPIIVYDDEGYYMASAIAELLAGEGHDVTYVTPASKVSAWSSYTSEQIEVHKRLDALGVSLVTDHALQSFATGEARLVSVYTARPRCLPAASLVAVTSRQPDDRLWLDMASANADGVTVQRIGDCRAPGIIAMAVHDGHRAARELGLPASAIMERRERVSL